ncbi:MAG: MerR family transcriptional regulator [Clostridia bacterium]|jgi:DNA-binding transcriptional MerR regulator|nr:MerR family transcriptional regulator [Clostridia bacterium]
MKTLTRRQTARKLNTNHLRLYYWEQKGLLKPKRIEVGNRILIAYSPEILEKARKLLSRDHRRKRKKK